MQPKLDLEPTAAFWHGADVYLLGRVPKLDASYNKVVAVAADVASISYTIYNHATGAVISGPTSLTPADVMLSAYSTGTVWQEDTTGFNFIAILASALFTADVVHRIKVTFTFAGSPARLGVVVFRLPARSAAAVG